ncbi:MAG: hypothetical protein R3E84_00555 [Pseudomonadales bacterium]
MTEEAIRRSRRQLLMMFGVAFGSMGLAYVVFYWITAGHTWGTTNKGTFVDPPRDVNSLAWQGATPVFETQGKWWLWLVVDRCDAVCASTMHDQRAIHILLNKESDRVARALLVGGADPGALTEEALQKVRVLPKPDLPEGVYIVDPHGNLVLTYPVDTPPKPVLSDLQHLLKFSQIG